MPYNVGTLLVACHPMREPPNAPHSTPHTQSSKCITLNVKSLPMADTHCAPHVGSLPMAATHCLVGTLPMPAADCLVGSLPMSATL